jgi:hypothetical protein
VAVRASEGVADRASASLGLALLSLVGAPLSFYLGTGTAQIGGGWLESMTPWSWFYFLLLVLFTAAGVAAVALGVRSLHVTSHRGRAWTGILLGGIAPLLGVALVVLAMVALFGSAPPPG